MSKPPHVFLGHVESVEHTVPLFPPGSETIRLTLDMNQLASVKIGDVVEVTDRIEDFVVDRIDFQPNNMGQLYLRKKELSMSVEPTPPIVLIKEELIEDDVDIWCELNQ